MEYQKKPADRRSVLTPAYSFEACRSENNCSSEGSFFHYSSVKTQPVNYESGSRPVRIAVTNSTCSGLSIEIDLTAKDPDNLL